MKKGNKRKAGREERPRKGRKEMKKSGEKVTRAEGMRDWVRGEK